jgi:hypothetical protein
VLKEMLLAHHIEQYFVFDMSIPDAVQYLRASMPIAARLSELEEGTQLLERADTIWLDAFYGEWYTDDLILSLQDKNKRVCIVSPELHGRPHDQLWTRLRRLPKHAQTELYLCTDFIDEAGRLFDVLQD